MITFLADDNLKRQIISGLLRRNPSVDVVRAQDVGLTGADDRNLLEWVARHDRVVLTHDVQTLVGFASEIGPGWQADGWGDRPGPEAASLRSR